MNVRRVAVLGAGAFGVATAVELADRGFAVHVVDRAVPPHPEASSTDTSKAVRADYGDDSFYTELALESLARWRDRNREAGTELFHPHGILMLASRSLDEPGFEGASYRALRARGLPLERTTTASRRRRFPEWVSDAYPDGYFNPEAGWVESARAVAALADAARRRGVVFTEATVVPFAEPGRGRRVVLASGETLEAEHVVVCAGAWTARLLPELADRLRAVGQPVVHFVPDRPERFAGPRFPVWCADIANTGWYGFPLSREGTLKIGHHGAGRPLSPGEPLAVTERELERTREFCRRTFPSLADAPVARTRLCLYCDTPDGDFLIDHHPDRPGVIVAAGGSGHGFKFAPVLGGIVADLVEGRPNPRLERFRYDRRPSRGGEAARHRR